MSLNINKKYTYNIAYEMKEDWFLPEFWPVVQTSIDNSKAFTYKDDDVIVCTYPRSGTHMTWMLVRYLLQGSTEPLKDIMEDSSLPPMTPNNKQEGTRVFNTHYLPAQFGDDFFMKKKHKFIHVLRNPKDAIVSYYHLIKMTKQTIKDMPKTWEDVLQFVFTTEMREYNWFLHMKAWEEFMDKNPSAPVLDLKFEEIVREPETAIKQMAEFLEVPLSDKFLQDLLIACKFEKMKDAPVSEWAKTSIAAEPEKLNFYRKGKIGDWVNTFTVAQNEMFDAAYEKEMKGSKLTFIYH